ncbi:Spp2/MOS2, G-patch domain,G-patch domain [Cinara cedri]|uniref:Spp2/MOS2, G-patch domain,G-patch domain n=1 Tax=Cinara cedri TaxID=506608 RepID=A0A5E4MM46_9HEMI|nr:Spp2/MOS2, G-patch domain,G-patch domain [Cinara cedri]
MEEDLKKISFSFKRVSSKPKILPAMSKTDTEKTVQFIECVDEKFIKCVGLVECNDDHGELVIPMQHTIKRYSPTKFIETKQNSTKNQIQENGAPTLDEIAVQAILSDVQKTEDQEDKDENNTKIIELPSIVNPPEGKETSTVEDYEKIPVNKFGLAMLRGMGWEQTKGIGKSSKVITNSLPEPRPKGMGLGADKLIKSVQKEQNSEEELKLTHGSYVQFVLGRLDGQYGEVIGFDEGDSRTVVKIARTSQVEKVNETTFRLVTKSDYDKNSKVINIKRYKEYHEGKTKSDNSDNEDGTHSYERKKNSIPDIYSSRHHKTKKSKHSKSPHRKHKSDHNKHKKYKHKRSSS